MDPPHKHHKKCIDKTDTIRTLYLPVILGKDQKEKCHPAFSILNYCGKEDKKLPQLFPELPNMIPSKVGKNIKS